MNQQNFLIKDITLSEDEEITEKTRVLTFDLTLLWITIAVLIILYFIDIWLWLKLLFLIPILWYGSYSVRQPWRLTLTNKRLVARRLYPRPLNYFFTKINNYPFKHLEGLSVGPKSNPTLFLIGLFLGANIGINLLKLSLSTAGLDLPDTLEFIIFMMKVTQVFAEEGNYLESQLDDYYRAAAKEILTFAGTVTIIIGIIFLIISFPWRKYMVIRVRFGKDFKLRAGISSSFIRKFYSQIYDENITTAPKKYRKWNFPWLEDEKVEGVADLENILYSTRVIGTFAMISGSIRIWTGVRDLSNFSSTDFLLWVLVAFIDLLIVILSIRFSKRSNEMVITNKRIIFAKEVQSLSGYSGKRRFYMSDLKRHDIASFNFSKVHGYAVEYLVGGIIVLYFTLSLIVTLGSIYPIFLGIVGVFLLFFINQTYISFELKTKSGDRWIMRHQLANPATRLRQYVGSENSNTVLSRLLTNRLEESEIINLVQILRAYDTGLEIQEFKKSIKNQISQVERTDEDLLEETLSEENFYQPHSQKFKSKGSRKKRRVKKNRKRIQLTIADLLLKREQIVWERSIPHPINRRKLSLMVGSFFFFLFTPLILFAALRLQINITSGVFRILRVDYLRLPWVVLAIIVLYILFFLKYYTLRRKSLLITEKRIFYEEIVSPPKFLFFLGIFRESHITESLLNQIQKVKSNQMLIQRNHLRHLKKYFKQFVIWIGLYILILYFYLLSRSYWKFLPSAEPIQDMFSILLIYGGMKVVWNISNLIIALVQSYPTMEMRAEGIGVTFILPYVNIDQVEKIQNIVWSGESSEKRLKTMIERKRQRKKREFGD